jgi:hypothetical protein
METKKREQGLSAMYNREEQASINRNKKEVHGGLYKNKYKRKLKYY